MSDIVLKTEHLGIRFGGLQAVDDFNIEIREGELWGLIGPNGAGKTTVFNMLTGVYVPTEGTVTLCGKVMNGKKQHEFVRQGIARTFQNIRLFRDMSVLDNVRVALSHQYRYNFFTALFRLPSYWKEEDRLMEEARRLLSIFSLEKKSKLKASELPYGEQRKLEIARALATGMRVLLLDEPAAGMNPTETAELLAAIRRIREEFGIAILLIEHDMSLVMNVCEQIQVISFGKTIAKGLPEEVANHPEVIEAYLGKENEEETEC